MKNVNYYFCALLLSFSIVFAQNLQELQKLQNEYKKVLEKQSLQKPAEISNAEQAAKSTALPDKLIYSRKDIESLLVNTEKLLNRLKFLEDSTEKMPYVGYEFFEKRDTIPFWQNLPISKNYTLGPGDEVIISMWGESNSYNTETINRDGQIYIENIGVLNLSDKNINEAKKYLTSKYSRVYSTLIGSFPKSFIDITLGELKSINVHFIGFVNIPGVHMIHPFSNVISGLIQAGGVKNQGTLREIIVLRDNKQIATIDLYDYIILGKPSLDIRLMDQDVVYISPRKSTIALTGRVLTPGYYETKAGESLSNLIDFSGGPATKSANSYFVYKNNIKNKEGYIISRDEINEFEITNGDSIHLPLYQYSQRLVEINGQVKNPGKYPFNKKTKLNHILKATMSLDDPDFKKTMNLSSITIFRKDTLSNSPVKILTSESENILLENDDRINVSKVDILEPIESVSISGEIVMPGTYPVNGLTTLEKIIEYSGGFTDFALKDGIEIFRDSLKIAWENNLFVLNDGDSINVAKKTGLVQISGEVNVPGYLSFKKNESLSKYIERAGGLTSFADEKNIYITYPNGSSANKKRFFSPKVKEGSRIVVTQRTISSKNKPSGLEVFSMLSSQAGSIATTLLSLSLIANQSSNGN
tara:strand:- start:1060 stop:2988 length:1929 start_codon:yes stop_codon:yes gene_type:complete